MYERLKDGQYKAPPLERVWLEKEDGRQRPIGKPAFEDKIVQRAVVMLLAAVYEQDFYGFPHGFRPGHSAHQALHGLREQCRELNIKMKSHHTSPLKKPGNVLSFADKNS